MADDDKDIDVSEKTRNALAQIHRAFMQPKKDDQGNSPRRLAWLEAWSEIKALSATELQELRAGIETTAHTLRKLNQKVEHLRSEKVKEMAESHKLKKDNEWEDDEFLDSSANLPVFNPKSKKSRGKNWVITPPIEKPKTTVEVCQAVWVALTNRAVYIVDSGRKNAPPSASRDLQVEKQRLMALPNIMDNKVVTDQLTGKPIMNLYQINAEVKEALLWLLAERAKVEILFRKLFARFLKKEIVEKAHLYKWANRYSAQAQKILEELSDEDPS